MSKIKICHITTVHSPFDVRIFHKECKTIAKAGFDVVLIAQHNKNEITDNIKIISLPIVRNRLKRILKLPIIALKLALRQHANLYHFHDPELILIGIILKIIGKKVIYDVHEDVPKQILSKPYLPQIIRPIIAKILEKTENLISKKFNLIITATPIIKERFKKICCKTIDIKNYPLLSEIYLTSETNKKEKVICYVGGISKIRGLFEMSEAVEKTETKLIIAGNFLNKEEKKEFFSKKYKNVEYVGYLEREKVLKLYKKSIAGLVLFHPEPNHLNSQPNKIFEYMCSGLPVIASNFKVFKEILEKNNCGICVNPLIHEEIINAINWIIEHPKEANKMGENGRKAVEKKYNWEKESIRFLNAYENVLRD